MCITNIYIHIIFYQNYWVFLEIPGASILKSTPDTKMILLAELTPRKIKKKRQRKKTSFQYFNGIEEVHGELDDTKQEHCTSAFMQH